MAEILRNKLNNKKEGDILTVQKNGSKLYKCEVCESVFKSKDKLKRHVVEIHERKKTFHVQDL